MGTKKNFVLDTNVILHDYNCLKNFQENDIYLPLVVLEELDKFKKGNEQINFNAREFVRELDVLTSDELFSDGVKLGEGLGRLCRDKQCAGCQSVGIVSYKETRSFDFGGNRIPDRQVSENEIYLSDQRCESAHESPFNRSALRRLYYG